MGIFAYRVFIYVVENYHVFLDFLQWLMYHFVWILCMDVDRLPAQCIRVGTIFVRGQSTLDLFIKQGLKQRTCTNYQYHLEATTATPKTCNMKILTDLLRLRFSIPFQPLPNTFKKSKIYSCIQLIFPPFEENTVRG